MDPERAGSREPWSWDLLQRMKLGEIDHLPELDKEQGTERGEHPRQGEQGGSVHERLHEQVVARNNFKISAQSGCADFYE